MDIALDTIDALDDGLARFDATHRLVLANRRLAEMLEYPAHLMRAGTPFLTFVAFNIARGEHGPGPRPRIVRQRLATLLDTYERRRPSGLLVRVRGKAMPDGGFLKVFTALAGGPPAVAALTARERDVLLWAARGKTAWETAAILRISPRTIEFHLANCRQKLGAGSKAQLLAVAAARGLIAV